MPKTPKSKSLVTLAAPKSAVPLYVLNKKTLNDFLAKQSTHMKNWVKELDFTATAGSYVRIPDANGKLFAILAGIEEEPSMWDIASLPSKFTKGHYILKGLSKAADIEKLALGWILGHHNFTLYKKGETSTATLCLPAKTRLDFIETLATAITETRDLITTPAEDMGPAELAEAIQKTGALYGAKTTKIVGEALLKKNYPAIHRVGRASASAPILVDLVWGNPKHPKVTLVGKGVCFDTGGLDMKPSSGMFLMRKDMGGAAVALGVARMIMAQKLPVRLRLLVPAVENSVSDNAYRPSDVITMRSGKTVEVGNTDAEGRLVLADALTEASTESPDILIDFATLTGAARSAVGTEISAFFTNDESLAGSLMKASEETEDFVWRLPLHQSYKKMLQTPFADITSSASSPYAGAITAALFLQQFIGKTEQWIHLDFMGWNTSARPGRPEGGEAMSLRAVYLLLEKLYARS